MNVFFNEKYFNDNDINPNNETNSIKTFFSIQSDNIIVSKDMMCQTDFINYIDTNTQTDDKLFNDKDIQTEIEKNDNSTQTENILIDHNTNDNVVQTNFNPFPLVCFNTPGFIIEDPVIFYKKENAKLKQHLANITTNFNELVQLVSKLTKLDNTNPEIDQIKRNLTIIVNRELRLKYAFPFINIKY